VGYIWESWHINGQYVVNIEFLYVWTVDYARSSSLLKNLYANHPLIGQFLLRNRKKFTINLPIKGNGLQYMAEDVSSYLINRPAKSNIIPLS
jgi:hypothetical protein